MTIVFPLRSIIVIPIFRDLEDKDAGARKLILARFRGSSQLGVACTGDASGGGAIQQFGIFSALSMFGPHALIQIDYWNFSSSLAVTYAYGQYATQEQDGLLITSTFAGGSSIANTNVMPIHALLPIISAATGFYFEAQNVNLSVYKADIAGKILDERYLP